MDVEKIRELLELIEESELEEFEIVVKSADGESIKLRKGARAGNVTTAQVFGGSGTPAQFAPSVSASSPTSAFSAGEPDKEIENLGLSEITSPIVGTFYRAPSPGADPYVKVGEHIEAGQVVCIVEAMKLMNEIQSDFAGKVVKILVENEQPVEFGQVMFLIDPD